MPLILYIQGINTIGTPWDLYYTYRYSIQNKYDIYVMHSGYQCSINTTFMLYLQIIKKHKYTIYVIHTSDHTV